MTKLATAAELERAIAFMRAQQLPLDWSCKPWKPRRTSDQNALSHTWYAQLATELREDSELGWKCYCKLHHGVPILRAEDAEYRATYDAVIRPLTYEQKLEAMKFWPVTSLMTKPQLSKYLEAVQEDFRARGVALEFPMECAA